MFAGKTLLAGGLALWCAMRFGLEQPQWALMTAFIVAQPLAGMVVSKGLARLLGTLCGTAMSLLFTALFAQAPWAFLLVLAAWLGLCTWASTLLRSAWSYVFVLAGYTVAIIVFPSLHQPLQIFEQAWARCSEISLGIICSTLVNVLLWPQRVEQSLLLQAQRLYRDGLQTAATALEAGRQRHAGLLGMLAQMVAVQVQREHAWFEGPQGRQRARAIHGLGYAMLGLLRSARGVSRQGHYQDLQTREQLLPWQQAMAEALQQADEQRLRSVTQAIRQALGEAQPLVRDGLMRLLVVADFACRSRAALDAVELRQAPAAVPGVFAEHRDVSLALVYGLRSALAFLAIAGFWMASAWTSAAGAMLLTAVVCSLFASRDNAVQIGLGFLRGICLAIPVAFFIGQVLLPQWNGFPLLCLALGVPLFIAALGMADLRTVGTSTSFALHTIVLVAPQNRMHYDVAFFLNEAVAMLVGVACAVMAFRLISVRHPAWLSRRLLQATLDDLARLTDRRLASAENWFGGRMADRLLQLARHASGLPEGRRSRWDEGLLLLDLGDEVLHLRHCLDRLGLARTRAAQVFMGRLRGVLTQGPAPEQGDALARSAGYLLSLLAAQDQEDARLAQAAVLQVCNTWRRCCEEVVDGTA